MQKSQNKQLPPTQESARMIVIHTSFYRPPYFAKRCRRGIIIFMFNIGEIWAYPTDTSFGLGVRIDDTKGLERLALLKGRKKDKYFSLMCANKEMLHTYANVPDNFNILEFFFEKPRTALLKPKHTLPKSNYWPMDKVAFRISTIPDIASNITIPITATSANISGKMPIFTIDELKKYFGEKIKIYDKILKLEEKPPSEIWDFTENPPKQLR